MVGNLSLTGGLHLTSSAGVRATSASASDSSVPAASSKLDPASSDMASSGAEKAPGAGGPQLKVASSDTQTDGNLEEQATEMSERKTVLIR